MMLPSVTLNSIKAESGHIMISDLRYQDLNARAQSLCDELGAILLTNRGWNKVIFKPGYAIVRVHND